MGDRIHVVEARKGRMRQQSLLPRYKLGRPVDKTPEDRTAEALFELLALYIELAAIARKAMRENNIPNATYQRLEFFEDRLPWLYAQTRLLPRELEENFYEDIVFMVQTLLQRSPVYPDPTDQ